MLCSSILHVCIYVRVNSTLDLLHNYRMMRKVSDETARNRPPIAKLNVGQKSFSRLLIVSMAIKREWGEKCTFRQVSGRRRASDRKFSRREPAENSIGMV